MVFRRVCVDSPAQVDLRASVGLEGYRRNIGDEIGVMVLLGVVDIRVVADFVTGRAHPAEAWGSPQCFQYLISVTCSM